jgi:hypothetical protein
MARPLEYSSARRVAMQGVLILVLGASILLAWLLSRVHAARINPSNWRTKRIGSFSLDVPEGWTASLLPAPEGHFIDVHEKGGQSGIDRDLRIFVLPLEEKSTSALDFAMGEFNDDFPADEFKPIDCLGQKSVWVQIPSQFAPDGIHLGQLAACAILPSHRVVWIKLAGPTVFVPGDIEVFKRMVQSLKDLRGKGQVVTAVEHGFQQASVWLDRSGQTTRGPKFLISSRD